MERQIPDRTGPTGSGPPRKGDLIFRNYFQLDQTDPFTLDPKFLEILVEWIAPIIFYTMDSVNLAF